MKDTTKREFRQEKRLLKRAGVKHSRRKIKHDLAANPDEAASQDVDYGPFRSAPLNGNDQDATRTRSGRHDRDR